MAKKSSGKAHIFTKMQGTGNDFIVFHEPGKSANYLNRPTVRALCNRRTGIGADGILVISSSKKAVLKMQIFNADGSEAEMCGNGIRCVAIYASENNLTKKKEFSVETLAGIIKVKLNGKRCTADIGEPKMKGKEIPVNLSGRVINRPLKVDNKDFRITCLSLGNPHCVIFLENLDTFDIGRYGPQVETLSIFPRKTNVEFVDIRSKDELVMRVWERGVGETHCCGTGSCAAAIASVLNGYTERKVKVVLKGGTLEVEWDRATNHVFLTGPAESVYDGKIIL